VIILLGIVAGLVLVGLLARRSRRFILPTDPAATRWWRDDPAAHRPGRIAEQGDAR
jgi:hypothetical protein